MNSLTLIFAAALATLATARPSVPRQETCLARRPAFVLAGDSTTAIGGGWGNGFSSFWQEYAWGVNLGHNGSTVPSFISGGDWDRAKLYVQDNIAWNDIYVTIQFGHNDIPTGISLDDYQANLQGLATDIQGLGATPILLAPITRRDFGAEGAFIDMLYDQRLRTIAAAEATGTLCLDLNQASINYVTAIGAAAAQTYNLIPTDTTHMNDYGGRVFGRLVADLLLAQQPCLAPWFAANQTLSDALANGIQA